MENWKDIYNHTLKNICEQDANEFDIIVEQETPTFTSDLINNPNAKSNSLFKLKLDNNATNDDYKKFVEFIYTYIGQDVYDYIDFDPDEEGDYE